MWDRCGAVKVADLPPSCMELSFSKNTEPHNASVGLVFILQGSSAIICVWMNGPLNLNENRKVLNKYPPFLRDGHSKYSHRLSHELNMVNFTKNHILYTNIRRSTRPLREVSTFIYLISKKSDVKAINSWVEYSSYKDTQPFLE